MSAKPRVSVAGSITNFFGGKKNVKKEREPTAEEKVLQAKTEQENVKKDEKKRIAFFKNKQEAAVCIQRAWRKHKKTKKRRQEKIFAESAKKAVRFRRIQASQAEWERQIAALTIQLAWRKFFRQKLLRQLNPNRKQLQMWDPQIVAIKQQKLIGQIYNEVIMAPFWHPTLRPAIRPFWLHLIPSAAAVSYNFAVDNYHPYKEWNGMHPHAWTGSLVNGQSPGDSPQPGAYPRERSRSSLFALNVRRV